VRVAVAGVYRAILPVLFIYTTVWSTSSAAVNMMRSTTHFTMVLIKITESDMAWSRPPMAKRRSLDDLSNRYPLDLRETLASTTSTSVPGIPGPRVIHRHD
jgi:hypothetical protein